MTYNIEVMEDILRARMVAGLISWEAIREELGKDFTGFYMWVHQFEPQAYSTYGCELPAVVKYMGSLNGR